MGFRSGALIKKSDNIYIGISYDYFYQQNLFVINSYQYDSSVELNKCVCCKTLYMKRQENGKWKVGNNENNIFTPLFDEDSLKIENYITYHHCRVNYVAPGNMGQHHSRLGITVNIR